MRRRTVLVVEDNPAVLRLMATILEGGYEVTTAADVAAALVLIDSRPFDVVLTDVRMPGGSGFDVLEAAREHAAGTPVIMITAYANAGDAAAAMQHGACDYLAKPLDADDVALAVARAAHLGAAARSVHANASRVPAADDRDATERGAGLQAALDEVRHRASRDFLASLLTTCGGDVDAAAARAALTRTTLARLLTRFGLRQPWAAE